MSKNFKNILIIKPSALGDIILALPALSALRENYPDAKISWLIRPEFAQLLENHPHLNDVILFDRKFLGKAWYNPRAFICLLSLIKQLRRSKFDVVIDLQGLFRTACLGWLSGCKKRLGPAMAREFAQIFYTHKIRRDQDCIHVVDYYLKIISSLVSGKMSLEPHFTLHASRDATDSISRMLTEHGIDTDNYAVLIPGSIHKDKCWPIERFAALADKISSQFGLSIIAIGSASERKIVEGLKNKANVSLVNFAGQTNLSELTALLKAAKLVVSNDTGPGHIAAALNVPLVMIFGPSNPIRLFPYRRPETLAAVDPFKRGLKLRSDDPKHDIKAISVDDVYRKVCEQMTHSS